MSRKEISIYISNRTKQILSVILSLVVYTVFFNWKAALLLVIAIAFHEQSHLWGAQKIGLKTDRWYLVPMIGGVSLITGRYRTLAQRAWVAIAGPIGGGLLAIFTGALYCVLGYGFGIFLSWMVAAAVWMLFLNAINLLPASFLDGGQLMGTITYSISRGLGVICFTVSTIIATLLLGRLNLTLGVVVGFFGGMAAWHEIKNWNHWRQGNEEMCSSDWTNPPRKLSHSQMFLVAGCWLGTIMVMVVAIALLVKIAPTVSLGYFFHR